VKSLALLNLSEIKYFNVLGDALCFKYFSKRYKEEPDDCHDFRGKAKKGHQTRSLKRAATLKTHVADIPIFISIEWVESMIC